MEAFIFVAIGLVSGGLICFFVYKALMAARFVSRADFERLQNESQALKIDAATRLTREEVARNYVATAVYDELQNRIRDLDRQISTKEETLIKYTGINASLVKENEHLKEKYQQFKGELTNLQEVSRQQFKNLANDIFEEKKNVFVESNKSELSNILDPLKSDLHTFKEKIENTRKEDIQDITSLKGELLNLQKLNLRLSEDAQALASALKSDVKMQGNWGEDRLNLILETEGLQRYIDYSREESYTDENTDKLRRPDFIIKLPDNKHIIIDSKVSLTAYVNYFNAEHPDEKKEYLRQHIRSIFDHIDKLGDKNYQSLTGLATPDYIFMFMPVEPALTLAMNQDPDVFNRALRRKIVLITPTTLVATLKVIKILWQKENQVKNVEEIFRQCGELYNKFVSFLEEMDKVEAGINAASRAHKEAMNKLTEGAKKGNTIIGRFEAIKNLEARTSKQIPPRYIAEIELLSDAETEEEIPGEELPQE